MVHEGAGQLVCCGQDMKLMDENVEDAATEKHVPVIKKDDKKITVTVGKVSHPMEDKHYIEWIEVIVDGRSHRKFLNPGDESKAEFCCLGENITARAYCNVHGLWKA